MSLITFKNLPDTSTPITAENLNNNFNELNNKINNIGSFAIGVMNNDYTIPAVDTNYKLPIDTIEASSGSSLTIYNDGIRIGAGVSKILVSANVYCYTNVANVEMLVYLYRNEGLIVVNNTKLIDDYEHIQMPMTPMTVSEGDIISLRVRQQGGTSPLIKNYSTGTMLNVVVIG